MPALTFAQWAEEKGRREKLARLLDEPVFRDAVDSLSRAFSEAAPELVGTNANPEKYPSAADLNNLLALRYAHRTGFFGFVNALHNLTKDRPLRASKQILPSLLPEDDTRRKQPKPQ